MTLDASSAILESSIFDTSRTYATPSEVKMIVATYSPVVKRTSTRSENTLDRVQKCRVEGYEFTLRYKVKMVAVNDHGYLVEDEKNIECLKQLRYGMTMFKKHSCLEEEEDHTGTYYSIKQLAPMLVKESQNSNLPDYHVCRTVLGNFVQGDVPRKLIENIRKSAMEMMGTGSTADSVALLPSFFEKIKKLGHYGDIQTADDSKMKKLVIENEKKVHKQGQLKLKEEDREKFKIDKVKLDKFVPDKKYLTGFSIVPSLMLLIVLRECLSYQLQMLVTSHIKTSMVSTCIRPAITPTSK